ncbi:MAG: amino acid permease [Desulfobulbus sp.]|jgi:D-serine/D-alanine/glycine transporter|uniref:amino acid permease n=1 Tax=Desulfobulbus sp. TaxID=895 RepID=UPI00284A1B92|nr:amino acid permease [Desulfobulbus sp.]MDR2549796.1 amino acid permease [Desulfobulbus sp.]
MENSSSHDMEPNSQKLKRGLANRHIQLIAIGGVIGTGLFMGSGRSISLAGPSILLVYLIIGFFLYFLMRAMGELLLSNLEYKSFMDFTEDLLGPWAGFFMGWTYWFCWVVTATAELIAIAGYIHFWLPDIPSWIPPSVFVLLIAGLNLVSVNLFGEMEFWFASIKILAILALILAGVVFVATGFKSPAGEMATLANLWTHGGFFPKGLMGFFAGFQSAVFAFVGIELVGATAAETKDPETILPKAINAIPLRTLFFYVFALLAIMCISPWPLVDPDSSPFVSTFMLVGIPSAAGVINFVVLTSAASSSNSGIYSSSRMLYGLSQVGDAPTLFGRLSRYRVPAFGLLFTCACLLISSVLLAIMPTIMTAFTVMTTLASVLFIFVWSLILLSYLAYARKHPQRRAISKFRLPGGRVTAWTTQFFFLFVLVLLALKKETRDVLLLTPLWFLLLGIGYRLSKPISPGSRS